jgi:hypothetical protein
VFDTRCPGGEGAKTSLPKVLHSFDGEDQLDRDAIRRLVA